MLGIKKGDGGGEYFWQTKFLKEIFLRKIKFFKNKFGQKIVCPKILFGQKKLQVKKNVGQKILGEKKTSSNFFVMLGGENKYSALREPPT